MTASEALGLLGLFMPGEVGYIEDPRNEGTETPPAAASGHVVDSGYIEDPRNEGTETPQQRRLSLIRL